MLSQKELRFGLGLAMKLIKAEGSSSAYLTSAHQLLRDIQHGVAKTKSPRRDYAALLVRAALKQKASLYVVNNKLTDAPTKGPSPER